MLFVCYNSIVIKRNAVENAYSSLDAILKKRYDMLPNIVATVKQSMQFETGTLEKIVALRNATSTGNLQSVERVGNENELSSLLSKVLVTVENYPDLKSNENIMHLQHSIMDIEEQISASRRAYNACVLAYNNQIQTIPSNLVADLMQATKMNYFETIAAERENVSVKDLFNEK
jgi:LemA protein